MNQCDHGLGPISGTEYGWMLYYIRPIRRCFRKTLRKQCCWCGEVRNA